MAGRERAYDIVLDSQGYLVSGASGAKPAWIVESVPAELGAPKEIGDRPERLESCHLGAGYGYHYVPACYSYALNMDGSQPGVVTMGPLVTRLTLGGTASVSDIFEIGSKLYVLGGRYCKRIDTTDDSVETPDDGDDGKDFGAGAVASKAVEYEGNVYVGFSSDTAIQKFTGSAWDNTDPDTSAATTVRAIYWAKDYLDSYGWRLWAAYSTAYVKPCKPSGAGTNNPLKVADWAANPFTIGDTGQAVTGMAGTDSIVWIGKKDGLYTLDWTGRAPNVLQQVSQLLDVDNGRNLAVDGETVLVPHVMGLLSYDRASGAVQVLQPLAKTGNLSGVWGTVTAQAKLGPWHYVAVYNGTDSYICKGRFPDQGESLPPGWVGPMIWHPVAKVASARLDCMWVSGLTTPARLWFGYTVSTTYDVGYIRISKTGNQLADSSLTFATSGSLYYSPLTFGTAGVPEELIGFDIENEGFSSSTYAQLFVSFDGGSYTQWGGNATTAGRTQLSLPSGTWRGYRTAVRLDLTNASSASTPKVRALVARAAMRPAMQDLVTTQILCVDDMRLRNGDRERKSGQALLTLLNALRDAAPKTMIDYWTGSARSRTVLVENVSETMIEQRGNDPAGYGVQLSFRVLA